MKIENIILKEEITWSDVQVKYSQNTILLQYIMQAGQDPRNKNEDGSIDWGAAIDLGSSNYNLDMQKQQSDAKKKPKSPGDEKPDNKKDSEGRGKYTRYRDGTVRGGNAQDTVPGLRDLPKIDTSTLSKSATSSFAFGQAAADIAGNKINYNKGNRLRMAASKKNTGKKL
jgi:hypothetical protein